MTRLDRRSEQFLASEEPIGGKVGAAGWWNETVTVLIRNGWFSDY